MNRPATLIGAVVLNFLIGLLCIFFGLLFVWAFLNGVHERVGLSPSFAIPARIIIFGTPIYGALAVVGAVGTWGRSRRGWWLCLGINGLGIAALAPWASSFDRTVGAVVSIVILGLAVLLLVAPRTRSALRD